MRGRPVRVLVLDAAAARRARLERLLEADPALQVIGSASSAPQAVELAQRKQADVILMGLSSTATQAVGWVQHIMHERALPIVGVGTGRAESIHQQAFPLMDAGAIAVVREPDAASDAVSGGEHVALLQTLRLMAEVKVVRRWTRLPLPTPTPTPMQSPPAARPARAPVIIQTRRPVELVAIGASTGGPVALKELLGPLPASFPVPILIVQHIAGGFVEGLASWLSASSSVRTEVARQGTRPEPGRAYIAPDGQHMRLGAGGRLEFDGGGPVNGHRPSVSCLFESIAATCAPRAIAILLTGMGTDGAAELKRLKDGGAVTIAQDRGSSVIHGMPGEAIRCGAATYVMSPKEIAAALPALAAK